MDEMDEASVTIHEPGWHRITFTGELGPDWSWTTTGIVVERLPDPVDDPGGGQVIRFDVDEQVKGG